MARNLERDHRVSPERARAFFDFVGGPTGARDLKDGLTDYFFEEIRVRRDPAFLDSRNRNNFVSGFGEPSPLIDPDQELARIVDLNGLASKVYSVAREQGAREFADLPADTNPDGQDVVRWLDDKLQDRTPSEVRTFVLASLEAINRLLETTPFQPSWATYWTTFERLLDLPPVRWLEALGLARPVSPRWVIVLRYRVREAGTVVRPTQLDADGYEFHFPSPPEAPLEVGGHPMELNPPAAGFTTAEEGQPASDGERNLSLMAFDPLPLEYIHQQIPHPPAHWLRSGEICRRIDRPTHEDLRLQRTVHSERLEFTYSPAVVMWMPEVL